MERDNLIPRVSFLESAITAQILDERYLYFTPPAVRKWLYRLMPVSASQLIEALFMIRYYDVVVSHSEKAGLPLALAMQLLRIRKPHVIIISRITSVDHHKARKKRWFMKHTRSAVSKYLIWSSVQRRIAIDELGIPPEKIILMKRGIDQKFWDAESQGTDTICAVGMEARDYPTLVEAIRPLHIPCHIAAGASRGELFNTVKKLNNISNLPDFITVGPRKPAALRELYARSRFTVIPLLQSDSDNGLTSMLESMAMGKPVICSRTEGQIDVLQDGITGILVPQGDPEAMRKAILELWNDPERCRSMGAAAKEYVHRIHNMEQFVHQIQSEITSLATKSVVSAPSQSTIL